MAKKKSKPMPSVEKKSEPKKQSEATTQKVSKDFEKHSKFSKFSEGK